MRYAREGFVINKDLEPIHLHPSIQQLYDHNHNTESVYLKRFHSLAPHVAEAAVSPRCPEDERLNHFLTKCSVNSARSRIKSHCNSAMISLLYTVVQDNFPEHLLHLPSILSAQMSYPLVSMCRSNPNNRLHNWNFTYAILRKLRLPIFDPLSLPLCWCGQTHDCYGDHIFCCSENNKKMAHNIIVDGWAHALQPVLATAGYIEPTSTLVTERANLIECSPGAKPLDLCFDIDPSRPTSTLPPCSYPTIGGDVTIAPPVPTTLVPDSENVIDTVTAIADTHLQTKERGKYARAAREDTVTGEKVPGERVIGQLLDRRIVLLAMVIDPHGRFGPILEKFLFDINPRKLLTFCNPRWPKPNAQRMYDLAHDSTCPSGIIPTATAVWRESKPRRFYGHSYTAPTPREHTLQQMGLVVTKAFGLHLRNSTRRMGIKPPRATDAPTLVDAVGIPEILFPDIPHITSPLAG